MLLEVGADVNVEDNHACMALFFATCNKFTEVAQLLASKGGIEKAGGKNSSSASVCMPAYDFFVFSNVFRQDDEPAKAEKQEKKEKKDKKEKDKKRGTIRSILILHCVDYYSHRKRLWVPALTQTPLYLYE